MRFAAVLVDTLVLFGLLILIMTVYVAVLASQGKVDPNDPAAAQELSRQIAASGPQVDLLFFAALFVYYAILEAIFSASVGKLVFGMRVVMRDGSRATGLAVVVRNLVRIPEAMFLYVPAGISYLASPQRQRLGDHAGRTVVVRRRARPGRSARRRRRPSARRGAPAAPRRAPPLRRRRRPPAAAGARAPPAGAEPAAGGAGFSDQARTPQDGRARHARSAPRVPPLLRARARRRHRRARRRLPEEYVGAWFTLTDAVTGLQARAPTPTAAASGDRRPVTAAQPDLVHLLRGAGALLHGLRRRGHPRGVPRGGARGDAGLLNAVMDGEGGGRRPCTRGASWPRARGGVLCSGSRAWRSSA